MKIKKIESASNAIFKSLATLSHSRGMGKEQRCLVSGEKIILELLAQNPDYLQDSNWIYFGEESPLFTKKNSPDRLLHLPKSLFKELDTLGTQSPLLEIPLPTLKEWTADLPPQGHQVLCALGDPNNLGALMRSAEAFGINSLILLQESCHPFHPKALKSSSGSGLRLNLMQGPSIHDLEETKSLWALDKSGKDIHNVKFPKDAYFLLGEEGLGIPAELKLECLAIPMADSVESLNATVAASILFYELSHQ